ncbi:PASTA domain-containing protein [Symbioplanes lichenis]|uniref:PASTA domain-containing protein n=1 Tax=Symbioplanes lichenis TaxID=1629072 RepID=UPI0027381EDE|nr:hypothetical protein [Actinoplanes lichenis]
MSHSWSPGRVLKAVAAVTGALVLCCGGVVAGAVIDDDSTWIASSPSTTPASPPPPSRPARAASPQLTVPDLRHENAAVAEEQLRGLGFTNVSLGTRNDSWVVLPESWTVRTQSVAPGRRLATDTLIVLFCAR